jgi:hypothetical protein
MAGHVERLLALAREEELEEGRECKLEAVVMGHIGRIATMIEAIAEQVVLIDARVKELSDAGRIQRRVDKIGRPSTDEERLGGIFLRLAALEDQVGRLHGDGK